ncbi:DUF6728 family protein [Reichenbachiella agariperforans]|uniref:Uncharacterized protein n=1 Tax=Reichenbachiella agariperforans TaxID=156994 RepID=A0A1M6REI5_REIAG|nr:DUF6728 family protein [Reichenbachiella agariperforans]MBU2915354.1 hypothetical protein [Reichenbachiella agariperforans]SHK30884.1 hypothetical protein SAMN04488028_104143 [Reichenbachiella agariperforans]
MTDEKHSKGGLRDFFSIGEVFGYFFKKKDSNKKADFNLRAMHFINKFAIIAFLLGIIYFLSKKFLF